MARHCAISVDVAGVEPALGPLNGHILVGGRTPFAERVVRRVSGSHKPRPPLKSQRRSCFLRASAASEPRLLTLTASASLSCSQRESFSPALPLLIAASRSALVHVGIRDLHPLPAASCGSRKELTSLSGHAFVRSMARVWYYSQYLTRVSSVEQKQVYIYQ